jgi:hypothetical protein
MSEEIDHNTGLMSDNLILMEALREIAETTADVESCRLAMSALTRTETGIVYIRSHPITL